MNINNIFTVILFSFLLSGCLKTVFLGNGYSLDNIDGFGYQLYFNNQGVILPKIDKYIVTDNAIYGKVIPPNYGLPKGYEGRDQGILL